MECLKIKKECPKFKNWLTTGYQTESIMADLEKKGKSNRFSEASKRSIRELGNIELCELGEIPKTV